MYRCCQVEDIYTDDNLFRILKVPTALADVAVIEMRQFSYRPKY